MSDHKPAPGTEDMKHVWRAIWWFLPASMLAFMLAVIMAQTVTDTEIIMNALREKLAYAGPNIGIGLGVNLFLEIVTRGQLMRGVIRGNMAAALVHVGFFGAVEFMLCFRT